MKPRHMRPRPISRPVNDRRNSICGSSELEVLDFQNWFEDGGIVEFEGVTWPELYIHVRKVDVEGDITWHRVFPRRVRKRLASRLEMTNGVLHWIYDPRP